MIGEATWARVLRIENTGATIRYPAVVYALAFEVGGLLWFYTDREGTQSLSLHRDHLAAEKADLAPLLQAIHPGFTAHAVLTEPARWGWFEGRLPNACFLESYAALRWRIDRGEPVREARLLSYYADRAGQRYGHTVLVYDTPRGTFVLDPQANGGSLQRPAGTEALAVAHTLWPGESIRTARWIPLRPEGVWVASAGGGRGEVTAARIGHP